MCKETGSPRLLLASVARAWGTNSVSEHQMTPQIAYLLCCGKSQCLLRGRKQHPWVCSSAWTAVTLNTRQHFTIKQTQMDSLPQANSTPRTQTSKGKEPRLLQKGKQAGNKESQALESHPPFCYPLSTTYVVGWQTRAGRDSDLKVKDWEMLWVSGVTEGSPHGENCVSSLPVPPSLCPGKPT